MWVDANFAKDDLTKVAGELCPLRIKIGADGSVLLSDPRGLELVPEVGLRLTVTIEIHWPVLGVQIPLSVRSATLEVRPQIVENAGGDILTFKLHLDDVDVSILPAFVDRGIVDLVNKELEGKHVELAWNFKKTLSHVFDLPEALVSVGALGLSATSGRVKITSEALALAVLFEAHVEPRAPVARPLPRVSPAIEARPTISRFRGVHRGNGLSRSPVALAAVCGVALAAGMGLLAVISQSRRPRTLLQHLREVVA
jgi:hypothetical protein